jgi:hypothetical protein
MFFHLPGNVILLGVHAVSNIQNMVLIERIVLLDFIHRLVSQKIEE